MAKSFLDELQEELVKLHTENKVSGLAPDIARGKSIEAFIRVCQNHKPTADEKKNFIRMVSSMDGELSADEVAIINSI